MWEFSLMTAVQSVEKSMGFVLHRWLIFLGVAAGFLLATLAGAGTAVGIGSLSSNSLLFGHFGAVAGFAVFAWLCYTTRRALYRIIRAPHLFLLSELSRNDSPLPEGRAQVEFARRGMAEHVPDPNLIWEIRGRTQAALARLPYLADPAAASSSVPWQTKLLGKARAWVSASNVDLIIAAIVDGRSTQAWQSARSGILLQAKNLSLLLKNRLALTAFEGFGWFLAYLLLQLAFRKIAGTLAFPTGIWPHIFAFLFAWNIKASFFEPITAAAMLQLRLEPPDVAEADHIAEQLAADSEPFRQIEARAADSEVTNQR